MLFTKIMPFFLSAEFRVLKRDLKRVIFDQWSKLNLGFDVEPEIWILKVIYYLLICFIFSVGLYCGFSKDKMPYENPSYGIRGADSGGPLICASGTRAILSGLNEAAFSDVKLQDGQRQIGAYGFTNVYHYIGWINHKIQSNGKSTCS